MEGRFGKRTSHVEEPVAYLVLLIAGLLMRFAIGSAFFHSLFAEMPHYATPFLDMREMREAFFTYERFGTFSLGPNHVSHNHLYLRVSDSIRPSVHQLA